VWLSLCPAAGADASSPRQIQGPDETSAHAGAMSEIVIATSNATRRRRRVDDRHQSSSLVIAPWPWPASAGLISRRDNSMNFYESAAQKLLWIVVDGGS